MTGTTLERLLPRLLADIEGSDGFWYGQRGEVTVYVVADDTHDRVRIMAPIGELRQPDPGFLAILLQANFDRALDAHYALRHREVWSVFMHPLSTLVADDIGLYMDQVVRLVHNTGKSYASTDLVFSIDDERLDADEDAFGDDDEVDTIERVPMDEEEGEEAGDDEAFELLLDDEIESPEDDEEDEHGEGWRKTGR